MKLDLSEVESQTLRVIQNLTTTLQNVGLTLSDVVKTNVSLSAMETSQE